MMFVMQSALSAWITITVKDDTGAPLVNRTVLLWSNTTLDISSIKLQNSINGLIVGKNVTTNTKGLARVEGSFIAGLNVTHVSVVDDELFYDNISTFVQLGLRTLSSYSNGIPVYTTTGFVFNSSNNVNTSALITVTRSIIYNVTIPLNKNATADQICPNKFMTLQRQAEDGTVAKIIWSGWTNYKCSLTVFWSRQMYEPTLSVSLRFIDIFLLANYSVVLQATNESKIGNITIQTIAATYDAAVYIYTESTPFIGMKAPIKLMNDIFNLTGMKVVMYQTSINNTNQSYMDMQTTDAYGKVQFIIPAAATGSTSIYSIRIFDPTYTYNETTSESITVAQSDLALKTIVLGKWNRTYTYAVLDKSYTTSGVTFTNFCNKVDQVNVTAPDHTLLYSGPNYGKCNILLNYSTYEYTPTVDDQLAITVDQYVTANFGVDHQVCASSYTCALGRTMNITMLSTNQTYQSTTQTYSSTGFIKTDGTTQDLTTLTTANPIQAITPLTTVRIIAREVFNTTKRIPNITLVIMYRDSTFQSFQNATTNDEGMATFTVPRNTNFIVKVYDPKLVFDYQSNYLDVVSTADPITPIYEPLPSTIPLTKNFTLTRNPMLSVPIHFVAANKQATSLYCPKVTRLVVLSPLKFELFNNSVNGSCTQIVTWSPNFYQPSNNDVLTVMMQTTTGLEIFSTIRLGSTSCMVLNETITGTTLEPAATIELYIFANESVRNGTYNNITVMLPNILIGITRTDDLTYYAVNQILSTNQFGFAKFLTCAGQYQYKLVQPYGEPTAYPQFATALYSVSVDRTITIGTITTNATVYMVRRQVHLIRVALKTVPLTTERCPNQYIKMYYALSGPVSYLQLWQGWTQNNCTISLTIPKNEDGTNSLTILKSPYLVYSFNSSYNDIIDLNRSIGNLTISDMMTDADLYINTTNMTFDNPLTAMTSIFVPIIVVTNQTTPVYNVTVQIMLNGVVLSQQNTNINGSVNFTVPQSLNYTVNISHFNFSYIQKLVNITVATTNLTTQTINIVADTKITSYVTLYNFTNTSVVTLNKKLDTVQTTYCQVLARIQILNYLGVILYDGPTDGTCLFKFTFSTTLYTPIAGENISVSMQNSTGSLIPFSTITLASSTGTTQVQTLFTNITAAITTISMYNLTVYLKEVGVKIVPSLKVSLINENPLFTASIPTNYTNQQGVTSFYVPYGKYSVNVEADSKGVFVTPTPQIIEVYTNTSTIVTLEKAVVDQTKLKTDLAAAAIIAPIVAIVIVLIFVWLFYYLEKQVAVFHISAARMVQSK